MNDHCLSCARVYTTLDNRLTNRQSAENVGPGAGMKETFDRFFDEHPWLLAVFLLACGLGNAYEAVYIRPDSFMSIVDWVFAAAGFLGFAGLMVKAIVDYLAKTND